MPSTPASFFAAFPVATVAQIRARTFHPFLYWVVVVATTTAGTTMADLADRSLGVGYVGGSLILFALLMAVIRAWWRAVGTVSVDAITTPKAEAFYWVTILASNTLGAALGDFLADDSGLGFELFWTAFIVTRPLGATLGDLLTKPHADGGFALSRINSSGLIALFIIVGIVALPQRAALRPGGQSGAMGRH
jgi:uncharacterized membrane-anchored protein